MGPEADEVKRYELRDGDETENIVVTNQDVYRTDDVDKTETEQELVRDIEATRAEMSETIDAIQQKLTPERLKAEAKEKAMEVREQVEEQAKDKVTELRHQVEDQAREKVMEVREEVRHQVQEVVHSQTVGRAEHMFEEAQYKAKGFLDTLIENPIPTALTALGIGWLVTQRNQSRTYRRVDLDKPGARLVPNYPDQERGQYRGQYRDYDYQPERRVQRITGEGRDRVEQARSMAGEAQYRAQDMVGDVQHRAQDMVGEVQHRAEDLADTAQYRAREAKSTLERMMSDNPVGLGVIALAVGAAIGMGVPETRMEHELMGDTRDNLMRKAQETAQSAVQDTVQTLHETVEKVQHVAEATQEAAKQEAKEQGLMGQGQKPGQSSMGTTGSPTGSTTGSSGTSTRG